MGCLVWLVGFVFACYALGAAFRGDLANTLVGLGACAVAVLVGAVASWHARRKA